MKSDLSAMTKAQLIDLAAGLGLTLNMAMLKADMISAIEAVM